MIGFSRWRNSGAKALKIAGEDIAIRKRVDNHETKKDAAALADYKRRKQLRILNAFGQFDFDPAYDYKAERHRQREKCLLLTL